MPWAAPRLAETHTRTAEAKPIGRRLLMLKEAAESHLNPRTVPEHIRRASRYSGQNSLGLILHHL